MKLLILLLNILPLSIIGNNKNTQGSFFPSLNDLKFFKHNFTLGWSGKIKFLENIPIYPFTSISVIVLDIEQLHEKGSELFEPDERLSEMCSEIDWKNNNRQEIRSSQMKSKLSNQYKLATLFTAGTHLDIPDSKWTKFMDGFRYKNTALNNLKEQLEIYIPKRSIKAYDIEFSNSEYYFALGGYVYKFIAGFQKKTLNGLFRLHLKIPYSQEFLEETKRGLLVALESLKNLPNQEEDKIKKATEIEEIIRDQDCGRNSYVEFVVAREIEIEPTADSSEKPRYNITFKEVTVNKSGRYENIPIFFFKNQLLFEEKNGYKMDNYVRFENLQLHRKDDMEELNSLLDEYFETPSPDTTNARPDTSQSRHGKRTFIILLASFSCLAIAIFSLGYYYRTKVRNCSNRVYKKRQGRKK